MLNKFHRFMIASSENIQLKSNGRFEVRPYYTGDRKAFIFGLITGVFINLAALYAIWNNPFESQVSNLALGAITMAAGGLCLFGGPHFVAEGSGGNPYPGVTIKNTIGYLLHELCLIGKTERRAEINAFFEAQRPLAEAYPAEAEDPNTFYKMQKFQEISKASIDEWIKSYIGKERSLLPLIKERVLGTTHLRTGVLYWSQLIPRAPLTIEDYRLLIQTCNLTDLDSLEGFGAIEREEIDRIFIAYRREELVRIFSSPFEIEIYLRALENCQEHQLSAPVFVDMRELYDWSQAIKAGIQNKKFHFPLTNPLIDKINSQPSIESLGTVSVIKDIQQLSYWAGVMRNCIKTRMDNVLAEKSILFGITQNDCPFIVFETNAAGKLIEAKKRANQGLSSSEMSLLTTYLKDMTKS